MFPSFETKRLLLKPISIDDAPSYQKYFADYDVIKTLGAFVPWPYPEDGAINFIRRILLNQNISKWTWGIFLKENPSELIGCVDLFRGEKENRGFWLAKKYWQKGIMWEALIPITDYAFNALGFDSLLLNNAVGNIASHKIKEKSGAQLLEIHEAKFVDPQYTHCEIWKLTKNDWFKFRTT